MSQPPARPWFRLASMARPAPPPPPRPPTPAPAPAPAPFLPQPFQPIVPVSQDGQAMPRPPSTIIPNIVTPRASAPPSPIQTPTPPIAPPVQVTAPPSSPSKAPPPATLINNTLTEDQSPKSPTKTATPSTIRSPTITSARSPPPPVFFKPPSPTIANKYSTSLPVSPGQKTSSSQITVTPPEVSYSSLPSSPKTKPSAPPPSPLPTTPAFRTVPSSPAPPPLWPSMAEKVTARGGTIMARVEKPWVESMVPESNMEKHLSYPPSPLALPPAQIKAAGSDLEPIPAKVEQKTVLMQEKEEKSKGTSTPPKTHTWNGYGIRSHSAETNGNNFNVMKSREAARKGKVMNTTHKKQYSSDSEEYGARVVTLAGENKGAVMELSPGGKKKGHGGGWSNSGQKLEEGSWRKKDEKHKAGGTETSPMDAFVNCNVQGVNNSILFNCSCTHNDPGVHLAVSRKINGGH